MEIKRDITAALLEWEQRPERKPLIIQGARQIGKTWIMRKFGEEYFDHVAYFNFDASEELCREFENTKNPERLIDILRLYTEYPIEPGRTLIIFDEIQQSNKALNSSARRLPNIIFLRQDRSWAYLFRREIRFL